MTNLDRETKAKELAAKDGKTWASLSGTERIEYGNKVDALSKSLPEHLEDIKARHDWASTEDDAITGSWYNVVCPCGWVGTATQNKHNSVMQANTHVSGIETGFREAWKLGLVKEQNSVPTDF